MSFLEIFNEDLILRVIWLEILREVVGNYIKSVKLVRYGHNGFSISINIRTLIVNEIIFPIRLRINGTLVRVLYSVLHSGEER